jgi:hypothetical protein
LLSVESRDSITPAIKIYPVKIPIITPKICLMCNEVSGRKGAPPIEYSDVE